MAEKNAAMNAVQSQLGAPSGASEDTPRRPEKHTFVSSTCGDLSVFFGSIAWPDENGKMGDATPVFHAKVRGYKNYKGYDAEVPLSDDPADLRKFAKALSDIADFVEKNKIGISRDNDINDIGDAASILCKKAA